MRMFLILALCVMLVGCTDIVPGSTESTKTTIVSIPELIIPDVQIIRFGIFASGKPMEMMQDFSPILDQLERYASDKLDTEVKIKLVLSKEVEDGISVVVEGTVDFARLGSASYTDAVAKDPNISILVTEDPVGNAGFYGIVIVHKNSPITDINQLRGKSFAFGNERSTVGRYVSQSFLADQDIKAVDLSRFEYLSRHDRVGEVVGSGEFIAGAVNEKAFNALITNGAPIRELARFETDSKPWIARSDLDEEIETVLRDGLLQLQNGALLSRLEITGFISGEDSDYASVRESILNNSRFFEGYTNPE